MARIITVCINYQRIISKKRLYAKQLPNKFK